MLSSSPPPGALPFAARVVLPRAASGVLVVSVLGVFGVYLRADGDEVSRGLGLFFCLGAVSATWRILTWRARNSRAERSVWRLFATGCLFYGVGAVTTVAFALIPATAGLLEVPAAVCAVMTFPLAYRALVRWSRHGAGVDPDDLLNGISSVLVAAAVIAAVLARHEPPRAGQLLLASLTWTQQLLVVQNAAVIVLVVAALTAAFSGRLYRDARLWLVTTAYVLAGSGGLAAMTGGGAAPAWAVPAWSLGLLLLSAAAVLPVRFVPTQSSDPVKSTVGSFVVVLAGLGVVAAVVLRGAPGVLAVCALLAVFGSSVRLLVNLRELAQLSISRTEALTDDLTGTANRRALLRGLEAKLAAGAPTHVVVFNLDHFKEVNDSLGHSAGDELLCMVAQRVGSRLRPSALLGRLGGDEFAIITGDEGARGGETVADLGELFVEPFRLAGMSVHVDLSAGYTTWHPRKVHDGLGVHDGSSTEDEIDAATLLRQADTAMYQAKRDGLHLVAYDPARHGDPRGLLSMVNDLRRGIRTGQLRVHYQPQLHAAGPHGRPRAGQLSGAEALVRWQHPHLGLLMPAQFLPMAQSHGLMDAITREVLAQAVAQQATWRAAGRQIRVSVNLSAGTLLDATLPQTVQGLLSHHRVPASSLVLEVTETALLREPERSLAVVEGLRELGVQVSIDDFGTGYSSLTQLRQLPVSELKLDQSFTMDLLTDPRAAAIVANTISLAHDLDLRVVAEGVEDEATLAALTALACDETQGYLHARPLPTADFDAWLIRHERSSARTGERPSSEDIRA